jgi:glutathione S-transferase
MQLIGQYDSPFVRRVGIALTWYGVPFTQLPLSVFSDADALGKYNPLRRVPTLIGDDGTCLVDSFVILDAIDEDVAHLHGDDWPRLLAPRSGPARRQVLRRCGLACGAADKVVSLVYEDHVREQRSARWTARSTTQVVDTLHWLENDYDSSAVELSHADVAVTCLLTFITQAQPSLLSRVRIPGLWALRERCEALSEFRDVSAPFTVGP